MSCRVIHMTHTGLVTSVCRPDAIPYDITNVKRVQCTVCSTADGTTAARKKLLYSS